MSFPEGAIAIGRISNVAINAAAVEVAFKDINGVAITLTEKQRIVINTIHVNNRATSKDVTFFQDADGDAGYDAGEEVMVFSFTGIGTFTDVYVDGLPMLRINAAGTNKLYAVGSAAGAVDIVVLGQIIKD